MKNGESPGRSIPLGWARQASVNAWVVVMALAFGALEAHAQEVLSCGTPIRRELADGAVHSYRFTLPAGATAVIQRSLVSGNIGLIKLDARGPGTVETSCTEQLVLVSRGGETTLDVSDCVDGPGPESGEYTLVLNVVSDDAGNCGAPLPCGATGDGVELAVPGEADSYTFSGEPEHEVHISLTDLESMAPGDLRLRAFDPDGNLVPESNTLGCDQDLFVRPASEGIYTVVVDACRAPRTGRYRVSFDEEDCPDGPTITYFGLTTADSFPLFPDGVDPLGRPIYTRLRGHGPSIVVEARPGRNRRPVGLVAEGDPVPDLQMMVSRPLGDGNPEVCDILPPRIGGVPGYADLDFSDVDSRRDALNDLGCRFDDGQGLHVARTEGQTACTRSNENVAGHDFVDPRTTAQFCAILARPWAFPFGDTIVAARLLDVNGEPGARREIVIRVTIDESTPTPSPTPTPTLPTPSPTRTPKPVPGCVADCNDSGSVAVDELITAIGIALGIRPMASCWPADDDSDGAVAANELVHAVANAVGGCNPP